MMKSMTSMSEEAGPAYIQTARVHGTIENAHLLTNERTGEMIASMRMNLETMTTCGTVYGISEDDGTADER